MVERRDRAVATFFANGALIANTSVTLDDDAAHHVRVRRLRAGSDVRLLNGAGAVATGVLAEAAAGRCVVEVSEVVEFPPPAPLELLVPVADRDRMLLAAEKAAELQITAWRPVLFARSRSVSPRGEGPRFRERVAARMRGALEQSGGAWLPEIHVERELPDALGEVPNSHTRLLLDSAGVPLATLVRPGASALAVGPEGGLEDGERRLAQDAGWSLASLGDTILRFETAIIAGAAVVRAAAAASLTRS